MRLENKVAIITGAASGFGEGMAKRFAEEGARVVVADLNAKNVRVRVIGSRDRLTSDIKGLLDKAEALTMRNRGLTLVIAFNYGARDELTRTMRAIGEDVAAGRLPASAIDEQLISSRLDTSFMPDPDLVIRTSGEMRLSNFLLWQAAYAELVFLPLYWPDFDRAAYLEGGAH